MVKSDEVCARLVAHLEGDNIQLCSLRVVLIPELHIQTIHSHCHQVADRLDRYLDNKQGHSLSAMYLDLDSLGEPRLSPSYVSNNHL